MPSRTMTTSEWSHPRAGLLMKLRLLLLPLLPPLPAATAELDDCISPTAGRGGGGGGGGAARLAGLGTDPWPAAPLFEVEE